MTGIDNFDPYGIVKQGTTLVAVKYNGGVLLASDTLVTSGVFITDRSSNKVQEMSPSPKHFGSIKVMKTGNSAHSQIISRTVFNYLNFYTMELKQNQELKLKTVVTMFKNICYNNKKFLQCSFIITNGKEIYTVTSGGACFKHDVMAVKGSGGVYLDGYLKKNVKENMSFYETRQMLIEGLALAIETDGSSGGNIRLVDVKESGEDSQEIIDNKELGNILSK